MIERFSKANVVAFIAPQGCLLLYGTYLAGLTSNVSHPPVNQSPTILTVVTLVTISSTVALPVSVFLQAWPNVVYSTVAGAIFICTLASNCMLFVPQVRGRLHQSTRQSVHQHPSKAFQSRASDSGSLQSTPRHTQTCWINDRCHGSSKL